MKIAMIDGGLHHPLVADAIPRRLSIIKTADLLSTNIMVYDVVIILSLTDENVLFRCKKKFADFVDLGGVLIVLGYRVFKTNWLSPLNFHRTSVTTSYADLNNDDSKQIFGLPLQISLSGIHAHGYLESYSPGTRIISHDEDNNAHTAVFRQSGKGTIFVTTLDPDFHIVSFETSVASRDTSRYLFTKIIDWAENEHSRMSFPILLRYRWFYSIPTGAAFKLWVLLLFFITITVVMTAMFFNNTNDKFYLALSMASSVTSLILALLSYRI